MIDCYLYLKSLNISIFSLTHLAVYTGKMIKMSLPKSLKTWL